MTLQRQNAKTLLDFHCPCCKRFLGRIDKTAPGLSWCAECEIEIATKPVARMVDPDTDRSNRCSAMTL